MLITSLKKSLQFKFVRITLNFPMSLSKKPTPAYSTLLGTASDSTHTGRQSWWRWSWEEGLGEDLRGQWGGRWGGTSKAWLMSKESGAVGFAGCVKVIKTFHDIRVCEVPRADHWDHSMEPIFLFLIIVQRRSAAARGMVVVYSDCLHQWNNREQS